MTKLFYYFIFHNIKLNLIELNWIRWIDIHIPPPLPLSTAAADDITDLIQFNLS